MGVRVPADSRAALEHVQILPLDDRPVVVSRKYWRPLRPSDALSHRLCSMARSVSTNSAVVVVEQAGVAADALALQHVALRVCEHRLAERPRLERHHREALEIRRHDQQFGRGHGVELVGVVEEPQMANSRMLRDRQQRIADQHERQPSDGIADRYALEEVEQLRAPFVLRRCGRRRRRTAPRMSNFWRKRFGCGLRGHVRADADDHPRHVLVARDRLDHRALFGRVVHQRADAAEDRREDRQADRRVALGGGHQDRRAGGRAHAVIRVVVAIAEEDAEVVVARRAARCDRPAPGSSGPSASSHVELVGDRVGLVEHALRPASERDGIALVLRPGTGAPGRR